MTRLAIWLLTLIALVVPMPLLAADGVGKTGTIKGTITFAGQPTADAVVSVEGIPWQKLETRNPKLETSKSAVMDQRDLKFIPRVLPVVAGTTVDFPNNDQTWHNVYSASDVELFDLGLYPPKKSRSVTFRRPGVVRILCNVHPNMEAFIVVKEHPYFSAADARGNYRIDGVPLGSYRLRVWHPEFGTRTVSFMMAREGEVLAIDVDLEARR